MKARKTTRRTALGLELEQAARDIRAHLEGRADFPVRKVVLPEQVNVKELRESARMSQAEFARSFCINPRTLQDWEQGRRVPDSTTRAYLTVIARNPKAVLKALGTS